MLTLISTIQHELDRRFTLTTRQVKWLGSKYIAVSFPHVYDYLEFINKTPLLQNFIRSEAKHYQDFLAKLPNKTHEERQIQLSTFRHFNLSQAYNFLQERIFLPIKQLSQETDRKKLDPWPLALTKTPFQIFFRLPLPILTRYKVIKFKAKRSSKDFQDTVKRDLQDLHNRLMNLLAEYEVMPQNIAKEPSEAVKQLGITPDTIWQNIEIVFTGEFTVKIIYKNKEYLTDHEQMGFADKRKPDETKAKSSWELLRLLAINNGTFPLFKLGKDEKAKRKKQKQELAKLLKLYFGLDDDPFHEITKEENEYKIKIKLVPEPESREQWEDRNIFETIKKYPTEFLGKY